MQAHTKERLTNEQTADVQSIISELARAGIQVKPERRQDVLFALLAMHRMGANIEKVKDATDAQIMDMYNGMLYIASQEYEIV